MRLWSLFWLYTVNEKPQNLMPKELNAPWWCVSGKHLKVWDWAKWKKEVLRHVCTFMCLFCCCTSPWIQWLFRCGKKKHCVLFIIMKTYREMLLFLRKKSKYWRSLYRQSEHPQPHVALVDDHLIPSLATINILNPTLTKTSECVNVILLGVDPYLPTLPLTFSFPLTWSFRMLTVYFKTLFTQE